MTSVHAELVAVVQVASWSNGGKGIKVVAAETHNFTPCGACRDWLWKFCYHRAEVVIVNGSGRYDNYVLSELCRNFPEEFSK